MAYTDLYLHNNRRVPVLLSVFIVSGLLMLLFILFRFKPMPSKADKRSITNLTIVNVAPTQTGIFWQTDAKETGWVMYGDNSNKMDKVAVDEKDVGDTKNQYRNHYVILKNLSENTTYYYKVVVNNKLVSDAGDKAFTIKTPFHLSADTNSSPAYGKIIQQNGTPVENVAVFLKINNAYPLFTFTKISGEWLIPLQYIVDTATNQERKLSADEKVTLELYSESGEKSTITADVSNINPVPQTTVLGTDYTFSQKNDVLAAYVSRAPTQSTVDIIFPQEGAVIATGKPLIKGMALPSKKVSVTLNPTQSSLNYAYDVVADKQGEWKVSLNSSLPVGGYVLTIKTENENGVMISKKRNFTISKVGQQVLGESTSATPSATLTPTTPPTLPSPTTYVNPSPTSSTYPSVTPLVTATPTVPVTGSNFVPLAGVSLGLVVVGLGVLLAF